MNKRTFLATE